MAYYDPTFDVNFAYGDNPVSKYGFTFTRATSATYVNASGLIATAASGELRYTYDPVTLSALGVLIEEQRTNLSTTSTEIAIGSNVSLTPSQASPDGGTSAVTVTESVTTSSHYSNQSSAISFTSGTTYTMSVFIKPGTATRIQLSGAGAVFGTAQYANFGLTGSGSVLASSGVTATIQRFGGGWYRCAIAVAATSTTTGNPFFCFIDSDAATRLPSYLGTGLTVTAFGWQIEAGASPTSYIPTTGTAATRNADVLPLTGAADVVAPWFNKDAGTWLVERYGSPAAIASAVCVDDGAATNRILVRQDASRVPHFIVGSTADVTGSAVVAGSAFKTAAAYAANDVSVSIGGGAVSTDATVTLPAGMTTARIGSSSAGEYANAPISRIRYYNSRIPDDDLLLLSNGVDLSTPLKGGRARKRLVYIVKQDDDLDSLIESLSQESVRDYL